MSNEDILLLIQGEAGADPAERVRLIDQLYQQNSGMIRKQADIYSRVSDFDFDDLVQEGYFALLGAVSAYDPGKGYQFIAYLRNALKWHYIRLVKGEPVTVSLDSPLSLDEDLSLHDVVADPAADVEADAVESEFLAECGRDLVRALQTLPDDQRTAFYLHMVNNIPYKDIARKTGHKDASAARSASMKALHTLRRLPYISRYEAYFSDKVLAAAFHHVGVAGYQRNKLSSTEKAAYKDMGVNVYDDLD